MCLDFKTGEVLWNERDDRSPPPACAHPVTANAKLYIRDQGVLFCYDVKAPGR